jgi:16S rRNA pseudouridine516 synthase
MVEKEYYALVDKPISDNDIKVLEQGVTLADGTVCRPAKVSVLSDDRCTVSIIITEGKYHEIKRMLGVVGAGVNELHRHRIGEVGTGCSG